MKREHWTACGIGAILAFLISLGAVGSLITGFDLNLEHMASVVLCCLVFSVVGSLCFGLRHGGTVLLCLLALLSGWLWHRGEPGEQILALIYQVSIKYDGAYGWGVLRLMEGDLNAYPADYPMMIIGCLSALGVSYTVVRRRSALWGCAGGIVPLCFCLVVTDTVPDTFYLFILLLGIIILILTGFVRRADARQGIRLTVMAAVPAVLALGMLFLAVPRESYVNRAAELQEKAVAFVEGIPDMAQEIPQLLEQIPEAAENATQQITGSFTGTTTREVRLDTVGSRSTYRYPVMDVTVRESGTLYLRGQDYDSYTGTGWTATQNRSEEFSGIGELSGDVIISTRGKKNVMYLPYYPSGGVTFTGGRLENREGLKEYVVNWQSLPGDWKQTVEDSDTWEYTDGQIASVGAAAEDTKDQWRYLNLPIETKERAQEFVDSLLSSERSATAKADTIAAFVRNSAEYDLDTGRMPRDEADFALWFLEDSETGYCVHFATAAVVLLRAANVEARYVTGYMVQVKAGETVTVTEEEAHAWAEYYEPALKVWIPLEATPADLRQEETEDTTGFQSGRETEPSEELPTGETLPPTEASRPGTVEKLPEMPGEEGPTREPVDLSWLEDVLRGVILAALAAGLLELQRKIRLRLRRRGQRRGAPNTRALACWRELELLARLRKETPSREAEQLAQKAKFSQHTLTDEELAVLEDQLRACRGLLREESWYRKLAYQYIFAIW